MSPDLGPEEEAGPLDGRLVAAPMPQLVGSGGHGCDCHEHE